MGKLFVVVDDEVDKKIRLLGLEKYGSMRGALSKIVEDALRFFIEKRSALVDESRR